MIYGIEKDFTFKINETVINTIVYENTPKLRKNIQILKQIKTKLIKKQNLLLKQINFLKEEIDKIKKEIDT